MQLPAYGSVDVPRGNTGIRAGLDVLGGIAFVLFVSLLCMRVGSAVFAGHGWAPAIAWESVWLIVAICCAPLMPSGVVHDISWHSTFKGLALDWPELLYATWILGAFVNYVGELRIEPGPLGLALAVGTAEEFVFRVLLLGWLVTKLRAPVALTVSAVVFGAAHLHSLSLLGFANVIPQIAGGFVLGAIYLRVRNPIPVILAHAYWDFPYFMALGRVSGGSTEGGMPSVASLAPWLVFVVYGLWLVRDGVSLPGRVSAIGSTATGSAVGARRA